MMIGKSMVSRFMEISPEQLKTLGADTKKQFVESSVESILRRLNKFLKKRIEDITQNSQNGIQPPSEIVFRSEDFTTDTNECFLAAVEVLKEAGYNCRFELDHGDMHDPITYKIIFKL